MRDHSRTEATADAAVHALGVTMSVVGAPILMLQAVRSGDLFRGSVIGFYAAGLLLMLTCSALYNLAGEGRAKAHLRKADHAAIFIMIAGTYAPIALLAIGGAWGWLLLAVVLAGCIVGGLLKIFAPGRFEAAAIAAYLLLGWVGIVAIEPLASALPAPQLLLLGAGGVLYSLGVVVHLWTSLRFHDAIWHLLVLGAAACHFVVVFNLAA